MRYRAALDDRATPLTCKMAWRMASSIASAEGAPCPVAVTCTVLTLPTSRPPVTERSAPAEEAAGTAKGTEEAGGALDSVLRSQAVSAMRTLNAAIQRIAFMAR